MDDIPTHRCNDSHEGPKKRKLSIEDLRQAYTVTSWLLPPHVFAKAEDQHAATLMGSNCSAARAMHFYLGKDMWRKQPRRDGVGLSQVFNAQLAFFGALVTIIAPIHRNIIHVLTILAPMHMNISFSICLCKGTQQKKRRDQIYKTKI
jgi:hypothetical protein